jgi:succinate dehydrogenase/fumarate reductase-like Fe-S protein
MASPGALAYLAWRALLAHPLKRLFRQPGTGLERFRAAYVPEGLVPTRPEDRAAGEAASACIACGICETGCDLAGAPPAVRALGLHAAFRLYARSAAGLPLAREALLACAGCAGCDALCPTGVPIARVLAHLRAAAAPGEPAPALPA